LLGLKSLSLCFAEIDNNSIPSLYFITPFLRNLSKLTILHYANWCNLDVGKKRVMDFNYLWQSLDHLKSDLKKLFVEGFAISLRKIPNEIPVLANLEELGFCGFVLGDTNIKTLFKIFPRRNIQTQKKNLLEIERLVIDDNQTFTRFLENLSDIPRQLQVSLNVDVRKLEPEGFVESLCSIGPSLNKRGLNKLTFSNAPNIENESLDKLKRVLREHPIFVHLGIMNQNERNILKNPITQEDEERRNQVEESPRMRIEEEGNGESRYESEEDSDFFSDEESINFDEISFDDKFDDIDED